jgi:hypothetical protein
MATYNKTEPTFEVRVFDVPGDKWYHIHKFPNRGEQLVHAAKFMDGYDWDHDGNIRKPHSIELITREILTHPKKEDKS